MYSNKCIGIGVIVIRCNSNTCNSNKCISALGISIIIGAIVIIMKHINNINDNNDGNSVVL